MLNNFPNIAFGIIFIIVGIIFVKSGGGFVKGYPVKGELGYLLIALGAAVAGLGVFKLIKNLGK